MTTIQDYRRVFIDHLPSEHHVFNPNAPTDPHLAALITAAQNAVDAWINGTQHQIDAAIHRLDVAQAEVWLSNA